MFSNPPLIWRHGEFGGHVKKMPESEGSYYLGYITRNNHILTLDGKLVEFAGPDATAAYREFIKKINKFAWSYNSND